MCSLPLKFGGMTLTVFEVSGLINCSTDSHQLSDWKLMNMPESGTGVFKRVSAIKPRSPTGVPLFIGKVSVTNFGKAAAGGGVGAQFAWTPERLALPFEAERLTRKSPSRTVTASVGAL